MCGDAICSAASSTSTSSPLRRDDRVSAPDGAPGARAHAERWVESVRRECLDRLLILGRRHLNHVLVTYVRHFNEHRPHRALAQRPPLSDEQPLADVIDLDRLRRRDLLGGLIHEYQRAA